MSNSRVIKLNEDGSHIHLNDKCFDYFHTTHPNGYLVIYGDRWYAQNILESKVAVGSYTERYRGDGSGDKDFELTHLNGDGIEPVPQIVSDFLTGLARNHQANVGH
jgi:hypothetical protein